MMNNLEYVKSIIPDFIRELQSSPELAEYLKHFYTISIDDIGVVQENQYMSQPSIHVNFTRIPPYKALTLSSFKGIQVRYTYIEQPWPGLLCAILTSGQNQYPISDETDYEMRTRWMRNFHIQQRAQTSAIDLARIKQIRREKERLDQPNEVASDQNAIIKSPTSPEDTKTEKYWTDDRKRNAKPRELRIPEPPESKE